MGKKFEESGPPPESVGSTLSKKQTWQGELTAVGTIAPVKGVALSNDAPGVVSED